MQYILKDGSVIKPFDHVTELYQELITAFKARSVSIAVINEQQRTTNLQFIDVDEDGFITGSYSNEPFNIRAWPS